MRKLILFQYIKYPNIPNTTNQLEGGINSQIQHLIVNHRGLDLGKWFKLDKG